jgi:hypothetical protein
VIIYNETRTRFLDDVLHNRLQVRLEEAFQTKTGSVPTDSRVWADGYTRFALAVGAAKIEDKVRVAIEYHISAAGRFRIDAILSGNDGVNDN